MNKLIKIFYLSLALTTLMGFTSFASDVRMQLFYGINNQAKNTTYMPFEVRLENRDESDFEGYIIVNVYESNESMYKYKTAVNIPRKNSILKNQNISVSPRNNTIIVELYNLQDELQGTERVNIDISSLSGKLLVGILSKSPKRLAYLDDLVLNNGNIKTRTVEISNESFENNRNILDQIDCLFISDINIQELNEGFNQALLNFINDGKVIFLGTGRNGGLGIPKAFQNYIYGPTIEDKINFNFNEYIKEESSRNVLPLQATKYFMIGNKAICSYDGEDYISRLNIGSGVLCNARFSFNDLDTYIQTNNKLIIKLMEEAIGKGKLEELSYSDKVVSTNDFYNVKNLIDLIDYNNFPNIIVFMIILAAYLFIIIFLTYSMVRAYDKRNMYPFFTALVSIVFIFITFIVIRGSRKYGTFLTYSSIIEIDDNSGKETAYLDFKTFDDKNFIFNTSYNNTLYPLIKNTNEPILLNNQSDDIQMKITNFEVENNVLYVDINNIKDFDDSIFVYKNNGFDSKDYNVDVDIRYFDNKFTGRVTNKMDKDIIDASIISYGKVLYLGNIKANTSITLRDAKIFNAPIGNNLMVSELTGYHPNTQFINFYLDNNIYQYYEGYKFLGFIDESLSLKFQSMNISGMEGKTLIVKNFKNNYRDADLIESSSYQYPIINISGQYSDQNNSIDGNTDVINEYQFDKNMKIEKICFDNITDFDVGRIEYNVAFYGNIYVYNFESSTYDLVNNEEITDNLSDYLIDNTIRCKFVPTNRDVLYRKISLPELRAIGRR